MSRSTVRQITQLKTSLQEMNFDDIQFLKGEQISRQKTLPDTIIANLSELRHLSDPIRGVDQLHHSLQTATMAYTSGASDEIVLCSLCHDIGKVIGQANHAGMSAEILKPYVSKDAYRIIQTHDIFQSKHFNHFLGKDPNGRDQFRNEKWFDLAVTFSDEWDSRAFDIRFQVKPLMEFAPLIRQFFAKPMSAAS